MRNNTKSQASIRSIMLITFAFLMLAVVYGIGTIIYSNWIQSAGNAAAILAGDLNDEICRQIDTFISAPMHVNHVHYRLIENGIVDMDNDAERDKFFASVLQAHSSDIYSFGFGAENGEYYGARRNEDGDIEILRNNAATGGASWYYALGDDMTAGAIAARLGKFDPRTSDWYQRAEESGAPVFSGIYKHFATDDLTVSAAYPVYQSDGRLLGVLGTHLILSSIDDYLGDIVQDKNGYALIVEKDTGHLIASSLDIDNFSILEDGALQRTDAADIGNEALIAAYNEYMHSGAGTMIDAYGKDRLYIKSSGFTAGGLDWIIINAVPERLFAGGLYDSIKLSMLLAAAAAMVSITVYYMLTRRLFGPINHLIDAAGKLSEGDLSQRVRVVRNDEIGSISAAFNKMADTLGTVVTNLEVMVKDRTEHLEQANASLKESRNQLQLILNSTAEAIYGVDRNDNCTFCNASCLQILGYQNQNELIGRNMHDMIHHSHRDGKPMPENECRIFKTIMEGKSSHVDDEVFWRSDGTSFDVEYNSHPQYEDGKIIGAVVTFVDNTERKAAQQQIQYLSWHDSLTGLYNRIRLEHEMKNIDTEENLPITIAFADVNGLKLTNDIFGHSAGDELLRTAGKVLKKFCREGDLVARAGGDEFVILCPGTGESEAKALIQSIKEGLAKEKVEAIKCSMSIGFSTKTEAVQDIERTMKNAEKEMYVDKAVNRKTVNSDLINTIIATLHNRYPQEKRHSIEVSMLCRAIGSAMKLPDYDMRKLEEAGYLHDIGKVVLEESLLNKKGKLTEEDMNKIQQHAIIGYRILNMFDDKLDLAEAVYSHHERWNGSGYPKGLSREEIPLPARIIAVAETYDRIVSGSANRKALDKTKALQIIRDNAGTAFDPDIVEILVRQVTMGGE